MSRPNTREQRLLDKRKKMPGQLADLHWHLENELTDLHVTWKEYETLYGTNERRIDLLNATAPSFFAHYQGMVWREIVMHLCRLTDPPKSAGKSTLTVRRLPDAVDDTQLKTRVKQEVDAAVQATDVVRDWRNRRLAHRDLEHALNPQVKPLASASRTDIERSLAALTRPMNTLATHYEDYHLDYCPITPFSGAQTLLYYLSSGLEADDRRKRSKEPWSPPHW